MSIVRASRAAAAAALFAVVLGGCALISLERLRVSVWPRDANVVLPAGSSPWVEFPSAPDEASVQRLFTLSSPRGSVAGDFRWAGTRMYFDPAPPLSPGVRYVLQFQGRVTLTDGESFDAGEEVPFYVLHAEGGPALQSALPVDGAMTAATVTPLVLDFSEAVDPDSFAREFTLQPSAETIVTWDVAGRQVTVTPKTPWTTLTTYTWTVTKDLTAPDGTPAGVDYSGRFRIQLDATAPSVTSVTPGLRSTFGPTPTANPLADDVLLVTFSEDVTADSLASALTISPTMRGSLLRVTSGPPAVFAFVPDGRWVMDQSYTLRIGTGLTDLSGNKLTTAYEPAPFKPDIPLQAVNSITASTGTWNVFDTLDPEPLTLDVDGNVTLAITFAVPLTPDAEVRLTSGILFDAYFPSTATVPSLMSVSWTGGTVLTLTYAGMTRSTATTTNYYKLTIPGGSPVSDNGCGSFLKGDIWLYFFTNP